MTVQNSLIGQHRFQKSQKGMNIYMLSSTPNIIVSILSANQNNVITLMEICYVSSSQNTMTSIYGEVDNSRISDLVCGHGLIEVHCYTGI